jgi:hypothetical protein
MATFEQDSVAAGRRWQSAGQAIAATQAAGPAVDTPERKEAYLQHQLATASGEALWAGARPPPLTEQFGLERVISNNDLISFDVLQKAIAIGRFVGLVSRRDVQRVPDRELVPLGTGSMVSPRLLLTNNHVLESAQAAAMAAVTFDYQRGEEGAVLATSTFELRPDAFFATDQELDYTLVAVAETAREGRPLAHFGWNRLIGTQGKILKGYPVHIIQHPEGGYKQIVLSGNRVLELFQHFFLYDADTLPGSSGAPVFNQQWEVVALHRRSVPRLVHGRIVTRGGQLWNDGIPQSEIDWVGNEGTRVSSLVKHITALQLEGQQDRLRRELLDADAPNPFRVSEKALGMAAKGPLLPGQGVPAGSSVQITVPLELRIAIGKPYVSPPSGRS